MSDFGLVERMRDHTGEVNCVIVGGDALYSASFDKTIKVYFIIESSLILFDNVINNLIQIWSTVNFKCMQSLEGHSKSVKCLFVAGGVLISGSNDGTIRVWWSFSFELIIINND